LGKEGLIELFLGLWLMVSPWIIPFSDAALPWSAVIMGGVVAVLAALSAFAGPGTQGA
jgi:hypothetical protein